MTNFIQEAYCDVDKVHVASQTIPFDEVDDETHGKTMMQNGLGLHNGQWITQRPGPFAAWIIAKTKGSDGWTICAA
ncbi:hypothetical protein RRG08_042185 [Elysia crispata]|uniref:Uncharacterized protein n=1 Tax=Elysia crispata TaxID=231223 RepID=A0AAE0YI35_9GAST|nr:hypothetical protein RRG08_042185 [Elysia crispata]